jgi:23S rRNA pseudouridine2605 synthase
MSKKPFEKYIKPELKGAKKKEAIRQQKRKLKEESRLRGEEFRKKEAEKYQAVGTRYVNTPDKRNPPPDAKGKRILPGAKSSVRSAATEDAEFKSQHTYTRLEEMPLNKFIAHAGICGRREAAELVKEGKVTVNGDIIYEPGYKVMGNEDIKVSGKKIFSQKNLVYVLLNKPKDYLTTLKDPEGRKTVIDLVKAATKERIYPVGRLDRNTTGVLLLTNDGELAQKLTHPSFEVKKIYEVKLDKPVQKNDIDAILNGVTLEDGFINADAVSYVDPKDKSLVGVEIHSGRNRIVRRIFEHLGYDVRNLDRVMFANLTKKNVDRGKWRHLNEKEVRLLKFMNQSFVRAKKERAESQDKQVNELLEQDKKPARAATKPRVKTAEPAARKRNYKEPATDTPRRAEKSFSRPSKRDEPAGDRKKIYKASGAEKTASSGKSFKPRSDNGGSGEKRSYQPSPAKRSTDRRR